MAQGRPPGILTDEVVEPMPDVLLAVLQRLQACAIVPGGEGGRAGHTPNSAIINIYTEGQMDLSHFVPSVLKGFRPYRPNCAFWTDLQLSHMCTSLVDYMTGTI